MPPLPIGIDGLPSMSATGGDSQTGRVQFGGINFAALPGEGVQSRGLVILGVAAIAAFYLLRR